MCEEQQHDVEGGECVSTRPSTVKATSHGAEHMEVRLAQLEREQEHLKSNVGHWREVQYERLVEASAVRVKFLEQMMAVGVAWMTSHTVFTLLSYLLVDVILDKSTASSVDKLLCRSVYVVIASILCPANAYLLQGDVIGGNTLLRDSLKLLAKMNPIILGWAWKDWVAQLITMGDGHVWWITWLVASCCTVVVAICEVSPWHLRAKLAVASPETDNYFSRALLLPGQVNLGMAFAWNKLLTADFKGWYKTRPGDVSTNMFLLLAIYIVYGSVIWTIAHSATRRWNSYKARQRKQDDGLPTSHHRFDWALGFRPTETYSSLDHALETLTKATTENFVTSLAFIFGWALYDVVNVLAFGVFYECGGSPLACTYQSNLVVAAILSVVLAYFVSRAKEMDDHLEAHQNELNLRITSMSLTAGWAWTKVFIMLFEELNRFSAAGAVQFPAQRPLLYFGVLLAFFSCLSIVYHSFMREQRLWSTYLRMEAEDSKLI